ERVLGERVRRLDRPQQEARTDHDGRRDREPEREVTDLRSVRELRQDDEDPPLAGSVADIPDGGPRDVDREPRRRAARPPGEVVMKSRKMIRWSGPGSHLDITVEEERR